MGPLGRGHCSGRTVRVRCSAVPSGSMGRMVMLRHELPDGTGHFDLMFERDGMEVERRVLTFRLAGTVALEVASSNEPLRIATAEVFESWIVAATARSQHESRQSEAANAEHGDLHRDGKRTTSRPCRAKRCAEICLITAGARGT